VLFVISVFGGIDRVYNSTSDHHLVLDLGYSRGTYIIIIQIP